MFNKIFCSHSKKNVQFISVLLSNEVQDMESTLLWTQREYFSLYGTYFIYCTECGSFVKSKDINRNFISFNLDDFFAVLLIISYFLLFVGIPLFYFFFIEDALSTKIYCGVCFISFWLFCFKYLR